jgi:dephospho-CoA kinase
MIVGLTGGIGSGKSTVSKLFEIMGCPVFHSDNVAKEVYFDAAVKSQVIKLLGSESYLTDTVINKPFITSKIFSDTNLLHALNAIIHPAVIQRTKRFKEQNPGKIIVKETALLFEAHLEKEVDKIIVVATEDTLRINRVMHRDGLTREEVLQKMRSQLPQEEKIKKADFVVRNNEETLLIPQVLEIYNTLKKTQNA